MPPPGTFVGHYDSLEGSNVTDFMSPNGGHPDRPQSWRQSTVEFDGAGLTLQCAAAAGDGFNENLEFNMPTESEYEKGDSVTVESTLRA